MKTGDWLIDLMPDEAIAPVRKQAGRVRKAWKLHSRPWETGVRVLRGDSHELLRDAVNEQAELFLSLVDDHLCGQFDQWIEIAADNHQADFRREMLPATADELRAEYDVKFSIYPMPQSSALDESIRAIYGDELDERMAELLTVAQRDAWLKLLGPVSHMAKKLAAPDDVFRNSLVENVRAMIAEIPTMNIVDQPELQQAAKDIEALCEKTPDELRSDPIVRKEVAMKAKALSAKFEKASRTIRIGGDGKVEKSGIVGAKPKRRIRRK